MSTHIFNPRMAHQKWRFLLLKQVNGADEAIKSPENRQVDVGASLSFMVNRSCQPDGGLSFDL